MESNCDTLPDIKLVPGTIYLLHNSVTKLSFWSNTTFVFSLYEWMSEFIHRVIVEISAVHLVKFAILTVTC